MNINNHPIHNIGNVAEYGDYLSNYTNIPLLDAETFDDHEHRNESEYYKDLRAALREALRKQKIHSRAVAKTNSKINKVSASLRKTARGKTKKRRRKTKSHKKKKISRRGKK